MPVVNWIKLMKIVIQKKTSSKKQTIRSDLQNYFFKKPQIPTLIDFSSLSEREDYSKRILQRLDVGVTDYTVLNIHKIGIEIPVRYVYEELLQWDGTSDYWPNQLARVKRINGDLKNIQIFLFGLENIGWKKKSTGQIIPLKPLFHMKAMKFRHTPVSSDADNARFMLYKCSGGYPIGIFSLYVRSSIAENKEKEQAQLFSMVAFNFYGKKQWFFTHFINKIWENFHNRITANILNRTKKIFEEKFQSAIEQLER
jgi:hypothetical protein